MYKVLIVEDESIIRRGLINQIDWETYGYEIIGQAANGKEGMEKIRYLQPDIVITDVNMPIMDGLEMLEKTYKDGNYFSILLSGYSEFEYAQKAMRYGAIRYLLKPLDRNELISVLKDAKNICDIGLRGKKQDTKIEYLSEDPSSENPVVRQMVDIVQKEYMKKLSMKVLVHRLHYSQTYLHQKFKQEMGITFTEYLNRYRIEQAQRYLKAGKTVTETASLCGYIDYKYFTHVFKKYTDLSPREYLKTQKV